MHADVRGLRDGSHLRSARCAFFGRLFKRLRPYQRHMYGDKISAVVGVQLNHTVLCLQFWDPGQLNVNTCRLLAFDEAFHGFVANFQFFRPRQGVTDFSLRRSHQQHAVFQLCSRAKQRGATQFELSSCVPILFGTKNKTRATRVFVAGYEA
jgi:hypothetical protein